MTGRRIADAVVAAGRRLADRGLAPGTSGNISVRTSDGWLLTPTGTALDALLADRLARLDRDGRHVGGDEPTKEQPLHAAVYAVRADAAAVVHLHSTHAVALACLAGVDPDEPLPPITPYQVMRVYPVRLVPYARPGSTELAGAVRARAAHAAALLLANHGSVVAAASLEAAVHAAEELEEAARLTLLLHGRSVRRLSDEQVADIARNLRT